MHRRDFLHPGRLVHSAGQLLGAGAPAPPPEAALLRTQRRAMATTFEVLLPLGTPDALDAAKAALDEIDRLEQQLTVYRDTSEVSRLNQLAAHTTVAVEEGLFGLLELAARISTATEGAFDITAGAIIKAWGFYRGPRRVPSDAERAAALERVGMRHVLLNAQDRTVRFQRLGLEINLGSIGKGYALDRVAGLLQREWNVTSGLLHGGHSSVCAVGTPPGDPRGWAVGVRHPWDTARRLAVIRLRDRALGTSAATFQHLEYNGQKLGHILDPRTGWPAGELASASVVARTAAEADALATAFFILGVDKARTYCDSHPDVGAVLLPNADDAEPVLLGLGPQDLDTTAF